jgi:hypothetical protein
MPDKSLRSRVFVCIGVVYHGVATGSIGTMGRETDIVRPIFRGSVEPLIETLPCRPIGAAE